MATLREYLRDTHLDQLFAIQGEDATYTPAGGSAADVKVIPVQPDEVEDLLGGTRVKSETTVFELRVSDVAAPANGDTLVHDGQTYTVKDAPERRDRLRLVWTLSTRKGA